MPKVISQMPDKPKAAPKPALKPKKAGPVTVNRPIIYPEVEVHMLWEGAEGPLTIDQAKGLLGWETETEFKARMKAEGREEAAARGYGKSSYLFKDEEDNKINCFNNAIYGEGPEGMVLVATNRPFDENWARRNAQEILTRHWAGPTTFPGETVNGESVIISRTARVLSAQHRLIGLVLAGQMWSGKNKNHWAKLWSTEPVMETVLISGISDDPRVTTTLDNVKPRTEADSIYTSDIFSGMDPAGRKECSRMLAAAIDLLWKHTGAGTSQVAGGGYSRYQTHSESTAFLGRHPKLLDCVRHIFEENKERVISALKLSPGQCAAVCYLMGCSASDGDTYRNPPKGAVPSEKQLDWQHWDKALEFWIQFGKDAEALSKDRDHPFRPVRRAIGDLADEEVSLGGRLNEKLCVLARAWEAWVGGEKLTDSNVALGPQSYLTDASGVRHLDDQTTFGGIDLGEPRRAQGEQDPPEQTPEEVEAAKKEVRKKQAAEVAAKLATVKGNLKEPKAGIMAYNGPPKAPNKPPAPKLAGGTEATGRYTGKTND